MWSSAGSRYRSSSSRSIAITSVARLAPLRCSRENLVGRVVVAQVVGGDRPQRPHDLEREVPAVRDELVARVEQRRAGGPRRRRAPRRIHDRWLSPTWSSTTRSGVTPNRRGEAALEPDRDVAQAQRAMPRVEQRLGHDPHRVREVEDPGVGRAASRGLLGDLEDERDRPQRLREAAGTRRLLADRAEPVGERLVDEPRRLAADPQLDQRERRRRRGPPTAVTGQDESSRPAARAAGSVPASPPTTSSRTGVGVEQDELVDRQHRRRAARSPRRARACRCSRRRPPRP